MEGSTRSWVMPLAKVGYMTKGAIYMILGALALMAALGVGGRTTDSKGAISTIGHQSFGRVLLGITAVGLVAYVVWRWAQTFVDPERRGRKPSALVRRAGFFISGATYASLAFFAGSAALGVGGGGGDSKQAISARIMEQPFGQWLMGAIGVIVIGVGLRQLQRAYQTKFLEKISGLDAKQEQLLRRAGQFGLSARGVVFGMLGAFVIQAAVTFDPNKAKGLSGALDELAAQPYGSVLLGVVAAGLFAYGVFSVMRGWFFRFKVKSFRSRPVAYA